MVVAGSGLEASGRSRGLDPAKQAVLDQGVEPVVHRLVGDRAEAGVDIGLHRVGGAMGVVFDRVEDGARTVILSSSSSAVGLSAASSRSAEEMSSNFAESMLLRCSSSSSAEFGS